MSHVQRGILRRTTPADEKHVERPQLTPHLRLHSLSDSETLLVSEDFNTLLHGALIADLLPLLDGGRPRDELIAALAPAHAPNEVLAGIAALAAKGYVVSGEHQMAEGQAAYWASLGASPRFAETRLACSQVSLQGDTRRLAPHLEAAGVGIGIGSGAVSLTVIVCDDYMEARLAEVNRSQLESAAPWMLVRPKGMTPLFGPVFGSSLEGPCWHCLGYRMQGHREVHSFLRNRGGEAAAFKPFAASAAAIEAMHALVAAEIAKWLVLAEDAPIHEHALAFNTGRFESTRHRVSRRPQCAACGDPDMRRRDRPFVPVALQPSPKNHVNSGGARTRSPEATLAQYRHLVSPVSGVVPWLARTTDEADAWLHVYWAGSNLAMNSGEMGALRRSLRSKSAGKGSTRAQSEVSALGEAIERYSGTCHGDEIRTRKRLIDFSEGEGAVHPNEVQLFSEHQLANAEAINAKGHPYNVVPHRFDPEAEVDWTPVWSLSAHRQRYLPTSMLYFGYSPEEPDAPGLIADSNGCAAGNTFEEAALQGILELVERDAFAIWWYNRLRLPAVDLASLEDAFIASASDYYAGHARDLWLLDMTSDLGIPAFVALSRRPGGETEDIIYGAGAHFDPRLAALRAICELNQCLTWLPRDGSADGRPMIDDPTALHWWKTGRLCECDWLAPAAGQPASKASDYPAAETSDTLEDIERCLGLLRNKGLELLVLDQTQPDIGMPVVRVIVPGMRHFWQRLAPGRLYDVPLSMGRLREPLNEADLNPTPVIA